MSTTKPTPEPKPPAAAPAPAPAASANPPAGGQYTLDPATGVLTLVTPSTTQE